jgi:predicted O-methyltransferase YrrM
MTHSKEAEGRLLGLTDADGLLEGITNFDKLTKYLQLGEDLRIHAVGEDSATFMRLICEIMSPSRTLELGTGIGYSTLWIADGIRRSEGRLTTVEIDSKKQQLAQALLRRYGLLDGVEFASDIDREILRTAKEGVDLVFLDLPKELYARSTSELIVNNSSAKWVLIADNVISHRAQLTEFLAVVDRRSTTHVLVPIGKGLELAVFEQENIGCPSMY